MPDVREKLVELLKKTPIAEINGHIAEAEACFVPHVFESMVDHLIANGVTIQRWIPVAERLPEIPHGWAENPEPVLYMMASTRTIRAGYYGEGGTYRDKYFREYYDSYEGVDADDVLCWMWQKDLPKPSLPEAPKGDD